MRGNDLKRAFISLTNELKNISELKLFLPADFFSSAML